MTIKLKIINLKNETWRILDPNEVSIFDTKSIKESFQTFAHKEFLLYLSQVPSPSMERLQWWRIKIYGNRVLIPDS